MDLELRKKKAWSEFGVSEIIGNILILMITVTLFSGIMAFVQQMPVPEQATKADFAAKVTFWSSGTKANLTVTHTGGDSIKAKDCIALVEVDGVNARYNMSNTILGLKGTTTWSTGVVWTVTLSTASYSSKIAVTVVDMVKKAAIWSSQVTGGTSGNAPNILQRYVDSDSQTPTADPVRKYDDFSFFVTITDPDGDLNTTTPGIWIDSSQLETDKSTSYSQHRTDYNKSGDTFQWDFTDIEVRKLTASMLDGKVIFIHAWDNHGHQSISSFTMSIVQLPVDTKYADFNPPEPNPSGDSNLPTYIRWFYDNQGFGVFAEKVLNGTPMGTPNTTAIITSFAKDQLVFVRFASKVMANIFTENRLLLTDIRTGLEVTPLFNGSSTSSKPFYPITGGGGVYVYESQFNTSPVPPGAFTLQISLKNQPSTGESQRVYGADKTLFITDGSSSIRFWPEVHLYKDSAYTTLWGNKSTPYEVTSSDKYKVYVAIKVQDCDTPATPSIADVRISDGSQSSELFGTPGSGSMISTTSSISPGSPPIYYYTFNIDLRLNNGVQWRGGNNTYTLHIAKMNDSNEGMYSLSEQIFINGAGSRADFFAGTTGMAGGGSNFASREYLFYIQNSNLFASRTMWRFDMTPPGDDYSVTAMRIGDIDGDGDKDVLIGQAYSNALLLFENTLNTFGSWQSGSTISRPDGYTYIVTWIAFGDVNGDGSNDFAYSNSNGHVVIYNTTYGSTGWIFTPPSGKGWSSPINKIYLEDMTGDGRADLVVMGANKIYIYDLKYFYDASLMADKGTMKKGVYAISTGMTSDFDIKDVDYDGHLDIITADTVAAFGGTNGVNVNFWRETTTPTTMLLDTGATGYIPKCGPGRWSAGFMSNTQTADGVYMRFVENNTGIDAQKGKVSVTMRFEALNSAPDQQLRIVARVGAEAGNGTSNEVFYAWYSVDNIVYTPVITIDSTSWKWYNYSLPSSVAGKTLYLRFTDSNQAPSSGAPTDYVDVDMAKIVSNIFGQYTPTIIKNDITWKSVRAASIDGSPADDKYMEIVAAKDGTPWTVYRYTTSWITATNVFASGASYPGATSSFYVTSASKYTTPFSTLAPTLFDAVDINGDGFTDILVSNYTIDTVPNPDKYMSSIGFYMNLWDGTNTIWRYFSVKTWSVDKPTGGGADPWVTISAVANLTVTT